MFVTAIIRRALRNLKQSPVLSSATIGTVAVSLAIIACFGIIVFNVQQLTVKWSKDVQILVYIDQQHSPVEVEAWIKEIRQIEGVKKISYISRKKAMKRFRARLEENADLLTGVNADILPASLEITLRDNFRNKAGVKKVVRHLKKKRAFSDLQYGQDWLDKFAAFITLLKVSAGLLGLFLMFATLLIVANTIKLTVYARRDEIEVMSLIGATPMYIKAPFLLEGALQGLAGGIIALLGAYIVFILLLEKGLKQLLMASGLERILFLPFGFQLLLIVSGLALGLFGSILSLRKFTRV